VGNQKNSRRLQNGFSLLELLVVVAIIGLIVAIAIPELLDAKNRAKQKGSMAEMRNWGVAISAYMAERGVVPPTITPAGVNVSTIHSDLVPYAVSALHDRDSWPHDMKVFSQDPISYTLASFGRNGLSELPLCISPATAFSWDLDTVLVDGIFTCTPN
jgi:prepilin-type N-terminal cleavage/methylation domain-containing protein